MKEEIENEEMEMPTPCQKCGVWFDLNDGARSDKWFPDTVICEQCGREEESEIEKDEEIEDLKNQISDAEWTIKDSIKRLEELGISHLHTERQEQGKECPLCRSLVKDWENEPEELWESFTNEAKQ